MHTWYVLIFYSVAEKYKLVHRVDAADPYPFARRVFTGWDYAVTFADTARRKALHIATDFRVYIHIFKCTCSTGYAYTVGDDCRDFEWRKKGIKVCHFIVGWISQYRASLFSLSKISVRILMNVIILSLLGVTCFSIYLVVENVARRGVMDSNFEEAIKRGIDGVWYLILSFQVSQKYCYYIWYMTLCVCSFK